MPFTLANGVTFLQDYNQQDSSAEAIRKYKKMLNDARMQMAKAGKFDFDKRNGILTLLGQVTDGTVSLALSPGTAVVGSGTNFLASHVGMHARFAGEPEIYLVTARASTTGITTSPAYAGETALSGATYELIKTRVALPARFRDLENPILGIQGAELYPTTLKEILQRLAFEQLVAEPSLYAFDNAEDSGTVPTPYLWVYPAPAVKRVIPYTYFVWPEEFTDDGDDFSLPYFAEQTLRSFALAELYREKGNKGMFETQQSLALKQAADLLGARRQADGPQRMMWNSARDMGGGVLDPDRRVDLS